LSQAKNGPGATDTEIKIGQTMSYSGPNSAFAVLGKIAVGYMKKINDRRNKGKDARRLGGIHHAKLAKLTC
jgi:hypothetical protein